MNEQAELTVNPVESETELIVPASPEANNEVSESASRAAAMIALNETAAQKDWSQDRVDAVQATIGSRIVDEKPVEGGLVSAIDNARARSGEEQTHAAALAALDQEAKRAEILNIEDTAAHKDWPEDRIQAAKAQVEAKYSK